MTIFCGNQKLNNNLSNKVHKTDIKQQNVFSEMITLHLIAKVLCKIWKKRVIDWLF